MKTTRIKNKIVDEIDALKSELEELDLEIKRLQKEKDLKMDTIAKRYENKLSKALRRQDFVISQMKQGNEYARKNLQTKGSGENE